MTAGTAVFTIEEYIRLKKKGRKLAMVTSYDSTFTRLINQVEGIDLILVGDSLGMVVQGHESTRAVTLDQMVYHTEIVARCSQHIPVVADMPYHTFDTPEEALDAAAKLMEAGAGAVKIEGNKPDVVWALAEHKIPVMGHLGLLPQTAENFKVQGKNTEDAARMLRDALELQERGAFAIVLECVPRSLGGAITKELDIPTIGIGAGPDCDGQVLVLQDLLGLTRGYLPKFVRKFADLGDSVTEALKDYAEEVKKGSFPGDEYSYH
jgi:3-methyl-2-oxobutanoate hydroxymethyltransferase